MPKNLFSIVKRVFQRHGINLDVTRRALSLGNADSITGWYAKSFSNSTVQMPIARKGSAPLGLPAGFNAKHDYTGWTSSTIAEGDEVLDANSNYFSVDLVSPIYSGSVLQCYECALSYNPFHADRPTTSGTWVSVGDPSYRVKVWLDQYLTAANMKEDDNSTNATTLTAMGEPDYPIQPVFLGSKNVDLAFSIGPSNGEPLIGHDKTAYGNKEHTPVNLLCIDKSGITARRLLWAGVQEIRRIGIAQPLGTGSVRVVASDKPKTQRAGSLTLYSCDVSITWTRDTT